MSELIVRLSKWNGHPKLQSQHWETSSAINMNFQKGGAKKTIDQKLDNLQEQLEELVEETKAPHGTIPFPSLGRKIQTQMRVQNDILMETRFDLKALTQLLQKYYLEHVPINFEYLKNNMDKVNDKIDRIEEHLQTYDAKKRKLTQTKIDKCRAKGKILGSKGRCVAIVDEDDEIHPIPEVSPDIGGLKSLPIKNVDSKKQLRLLKDISKKLNLLLFKYSHVMPPHLADVPGSMAYSPIRFWIPKTDYNPLTDVILQENLGMVQIQRY